MNLPVAGLDVWLAFDGALRDAAALRSYEAMLEPAELQRRDRLAGEDQRHQFLITRALQRTVLASYLPGVAPRDLRFIAAPQGKPRLAAEFAAHDLHFSLAHTQGLVALAVGREPALGIDVENATAKTAPVEIANRFFSAQEARDLAALPAGERAARFYALWTLKESWLKATGLGIAAGLGNVSFEFGDDHRAARASFVSDDARQWTFWQARPTSEHVLALALRSTSVAQVRMWNCVPGTPPLRESLPPPLPGASSQKERAQP